MDSPSYPYKPIYSVSALSRALDEPVALLLHLAKKSDLMYRSVPQKKKDGTPRQTYDAHEPLKRIQKKIAARILNKISFPKYLHGGVKDKSSPRSIYSNARIHAGANLVVLMDIEDFYPSISDVHVVKILTGCLGFGEDVSKLLAQLLTREGKVPQGACTSSHLANLVFWDVESELYRKLFEAGFNYSRFADDITLSSATDRDDQTMGEVVSSVIAMLSRKGCRLKRSKFHIRRRGQAVQSKDGGYGSLTVTGLTIVNKSGVGIAQEDRNKIRASVKEVEVMAHIGTPWLELEPLLNRAMGRVGRLIACRSREGRRLQRRLNVVRDFYDHSIFENHAGLISSQQLNREAIIPSAEDLPPPF